MTIGIGVGALDSNEARFFAASGIAATIANRRGPESLEGLIRELGPNIKARAVREAASAEIVLLAVRWDDLETALRGLSPWAGRIVIGATTTDHFTVDVGGPLASMPFVPLASANFIEV